MPGSILIAVSDGFGGYGDFLFALKLAEQLKKHYIALLGKDHAPEIKLITHPSGKKKIQSLQGDMDFGVEVLTPFGLKEKIEKKEIEVASIIEGPVFLSSFIQQINTAIQKQSHPVPLIMIPEYAYSATSHRHMINNHIQFRKKALNKLAYLETIYTGFNSKTKERGILLSDDMIRPEEPSALSLKLEEKISEALLSGKNIARYQTNTDMYFQYSHDTFPTIPVTSAAERFLKIHRIYAKSSNKNQDILMVGKTERTKREALEKVKKQLIADGFTKISFYNAETKIEEYLLGNPNTEGRHYRVVYSSGMSHTSMVAAQALSGDLIGATGDQSLGEAISGDKILVYECLSHKWLLSYEYYNQLKKHDPLCAEVLDLLSKAESELDYNRLQALLTEEMKARLKSLSKRFRKSGELIKFAVNAVMPAELLSQQIISGALSPYTDDAEAISSFEKTLAFGNFDAVPYVVDHYTSTIDDRQKFCEILTKTDHQGRPLLSVLRNAKLDSLETKRASYLVTQFTLDKYTAPAGSKREKMFNAYKELISTFTILGEDQQDEEALIGLMLLTTKNISKEYSFLSPRKGLFFGSRFYSTLEDALNNLGINLKKITTQEKQRYYSALARVMENNPNLIANEYLLDSLSKEANITLPKIPPLLSKQEAIQLLQKHTKPEDETVLPTPTGVYKTHATPLGQGGWGCVYAARHYSNVKNELKVSPPLAIKMMNLAGQRTLNKEMQMFKAVYPDQHFEQFNIPEKACLAMPLFPGLPLDDYLKDHLELSIEMRKEMVSSLLENLKKIHEAHITHNDLKPKNILFDPVLKKMHIIDFGCAEPAGRRLKYKEFNTAIFAFEMPPEYMIGAEASAQMDIFSLTPLIAEILGANKREFVAARMARALEKINNPQLVRVIKQAFSESETLEIALFSAKVYPLTQTKDFKSFVTHYVSDQYDFTPYKELLGAEVIDLLNTMQNTTPDLRPSIDEALDILNRKEAAKILENNL